MTFFLPLDCRVIDTSHYLSCFSWFAVFSHESFNIKEKKIDITHAHNMHTQTPKDNILIKPLPWIMKMKMPPLFPFYLNVAV